ncbi:MAG: helix-turn-helix domain-containing protein, partial [Actinobacteria bacterium]|nr:helix-turn-helix domain-containing protein [Actinomycetota bacterium]
MRPVLGTRDITTLYQVLTKAGLSQHRIAKLTGQAQSEVCEILKGRRVIAYDVHRRIAEGLGIPPGRMGLAYDAGYEPRQDLGQEAPQRKETPEQMRRRALMGATSLAALGRVVQGLGELTELALPTEEPLPSRLSMAHVHTVEAVIVQLRGMARQFGGQAGLFGAAARYYTRWLSVPATDAVKARLDAAVAELHTEAGWSFYDSGVDGTGFFSRALRLADEAGDGFGIANAAWHAGATLVRSGHPDDALKCLQLGQFVLAGFQPAKAKPATLRTDDPRVPTLAARLSLNSATAYALMDTPDQAKRCLAEAHEGWAPRDAFEQAGMDRATAGIQIDLRQLDTAESFAASAVRTYDDAHRRGRTSAALTLAEVHVRAGEPRGLGLAQQAIEAVSTLQSVAVRRERLVPLTAALEARPGSDAKELARMARQIAATRM